MPVDVEFFPCGPEGDATALQGVCVPQGPDAGYYKHVEDEIRGKTLTVVVQHAITEDSNGIAVWRQGQDMATWYLEGSHFKNTLLTDPEFDALVSTFVFEI